jgi:hypothetical protein
LKKLAATSDGENGISRFKASLDFESNDHFPLKPPLARLAAGMEQTA